MFTAVTMEQNAIWAYSQKKWIHVIKAYTVVDSLLGKIHLSGRLDKLSENDMQVFKSIRQGLKTGLPF